MVGEADKRRRGGGRRRGESVFAVGVEGGVGGIMSDVFPASTFRCSHCHQHSSS